MKILNLVLCFVVIGLLEACQTTQSQYVNWMKQHPEYPYFALAETISGKTSKGTGAAYNRADANAAAVRNCMSASNGLQCYVTYENFNFVDQYVYQNRNNPQILKQEEEKAYIARLQNTCTSYGFQPGTDAFSNCLMSQNQANLTAKQNQQMIDAANKSANAAQRSLQLQQRQDAANQQPQQIIINSSPTYCRSTVNGNLVTSICN